jgi:hypothetical protein
LLRQRENIADVSIGSFATKLGYPCDVRFATISDRTADIAGVPDRANTGSDGDGSGKQKAARRRLSISI